MNLVLSKNLPSSQIACIETVLGSLEILVASERAIVMRSVVVGAQFEDIIFNQTTLPTLQHPTIRIK